MKARLFGFGLVAWILPAVLAGAFGWRGVWGTGSAFGDYLIPFPTTGGFLHLASFAFSLVVIAQRQAGRGLLAQYARPLLLGMSLAGAVLLLELPNWYLALTTDVPLPHGSQAIAQNPLGLFMLSDGLLAQLWLAPQAGQRPSLLGMTMSVLAVSAPPLVVGNAFLQATSVTQHELRPGMSQSGPERADEIMGIYSGGGLTPAELERRLAADAGLALPPEQNINVEDQAVYFYDSLQAARMLDPDAVKLTLCRYEDGTPPRWMSGRGDCFSGHTSFSERARAAYDAVGRDHSPDARRYLAYRQVCAGVALVAEAAFSAVEEQRICVAVPRLREELQRRPDLTEADRRALAE